MYRHILRFLLLVALGLLLTGCGGTQLSAFQPFSQHLNQYKDFYLSVEGAVTEDFAEEATVLEERVRDKVDKLQLFRKAHYGQCTDSCEAALNVKAVITEVNKVSGSSRFWLGMFAGDAKLVTEVTFNEAATGEVVGVYEITRTSGSSGFSGDTGSVVRNTADEIVKLIKENFS
jgi:hypothetical protein